MKPAIIFTAAILLFFAACKKDIKVISQDEVYGKWQLSTINVQSYMVPVGITWDTTYNATAADYIDLSIKGEIDFYINQQHRTDTYDTTKYDLLKDTLVAVNTPGQFGGHYVALSNLNSAHITLKETMFGIDSGTETYYKLGR